MFSPERIKTQADLTLSRLISQKDLSWHGYVLQVVARACMRSAPFTSVNLVARATFLSTLGIHSFCRGDRQVSYDIFGILHDFTNDRLTRLEVVRSCREVRKSLNLSKEFCDEVLNYFRANAHTIIAFVDSVPGDLVPGPSASTAGVSDHGASHRSNA